MAADLQSTALYQFLAGGESSYAAKLEELRHEVAGWLSYTTASFGHYTAHTVSHSEEIIRQIGNLLFHDGDPGRSVVDLSAVEAYVLCAAALLHDTGMVVSDAEKTAILESTEWADWLRTDGRAHERYEEVEALRTVATEDAQHFAADRELRLLLSEFVRRTHHARSAEFITAHEDQLGRFAFGDPLLLRTIRDVCVAHGLEVYELEDGFTYPEQRDVRGEKVNVRFCALLLRLGDLLDLSYDRSCPLLLNAASPLPSESVAHWTQYHRIVHRETDPTRIEIAAECNTQLEHRYLHDWCKWLVSEVREAGRLMAHASRHGQWVPPAATLGPDGSIRIERSSTASYIPTEWVLELDTEEVLSRLINDVTATPFAFVRELLQNACDATRSRMYADLSSSGLEVPSSPQDAPAELRAKYPISVRRYEVQRFNELSQAYEACQVIAVEDPGIGMDRDVIQRFFLQVGRSYYRSAEFARQFGFVPTSRFGVGFLSVFAHSDEVRVDTLREGAAPADALTLTLTGPRNYLLTEVGTRTSPGTRVEVLLRRRDDRVELSELVRSWCKRVEFPVVVDDHGTVTRIEAESATDFVYEEPDVTQPGATMGVRAEPVKTADVDGEIYIFYRRTPDGESWAEFAWANYAYPTRHPNAHAPRIPNDLLCAHGIAVSAESGPVLSGVTARLDYRGRADVLSLDRERFGPHHRGDVGLRDPAVVECLDALVVGHMATSPLARGDEGWRYRQRLMGMIPDLTIWRDTPDMVRAFHHGAEAAYSLGALAESSVLEVIVPSSGQTGHMSDAGEVPRLPTSYVDACASQARALLFAGRAVTQADRLADGAWLFHWELADPADRLVLGWNRYADVVCLPAGLISVRANHVWSDTYEHVILNRTHPTVEWLLKVAAVADAAPETSKRLATLMELLGKPTAHGGFQIEKFNRYVDQWRESGDSPLPPAEDVLSEEFR